MVTVVFPAPVWAAATTKADGSEDLRVTSL